ncbi:E3 ubiquitin-protein ligase COP1-like isoform X2 [Cucurbita maxima]|uniref:E3 ubiquitin-protein ligase COP1-like isoform X2 n=1 Tax=Cucurbita maxima TaxID=3661 RepID=A0A6J1I4X5_CUCMA|nr:E3 ubiquitin-protein ligase COP1-like isoform X2 [Cucurbita maxima]
MGEGSTGALVPAVKSEPAASSISDCSLTDFDTVVRLRLSWIRTSSARFAFRSLAMRSSLLVAIASAICASFHLHKKSDCPCCSQHLTSDQLFPNFSLDKLIMIRFFCTTLWILKKTSAHQIAKTSTPIEFFRCALQGVSHQWSVHLICKLKCPGIFVRRNRKSPDS